MGVTKGPLPLGEPQVCPFGCLVPCSANQPNLNTTIAFPTASRGSLSCLVSRVAARPWRTLCMSVHTQGLSVRHPGLGCKHSSLMGLLLPPSHPRSAGDSRPVRVRETLPSDQGLIGATVSEIRYLMQSKEIKQRFKLNSPPSRRRNEVMPSPTTPCPPPSSLWQDRKIPGLSLAHSVESGALLTWPMIGCNRECPTSCLCTAIVCDAATSIYATSPVLPVCTT